MTKAASEIHPTAIIDASATIASNCRIGAFCIIGKNCSIGAGSDLANHVELADNTIIGQNCIIASFSIIGAQAGMRELPATNFGVIIDDDCKILEQCCICHGTRQATRIGKRALLMNAVHIGHDCEVLDEAIIAAQSALGGHVVIEANAFISGQVVVHQNCRIGRLAMVSGLLAVAEDIPPFVNTNGSRRAYIDTVNLVGMRRQKIPNAKIRLVASVYKRIFATTGSLQARLEQLADEYNEDAMIQEIISFCRSNQRNRPLARYYQQEQLNKAKNKAN